MRVLLGELAPVLGDPEANVRKISACVLAARADLAVFPELFLSGYRVGDRVHHAAFDPESVPIRALVELAKERSTHLILGAPWHSPERRGETWNAVLSIDALGGIAVQGKRYLPTFGPFEEGTLFTPVGSSEPVSVLGHPTGLAICYDAFFPEVARELALDGASFLAIVSAAPVTSRRLFDRVLPTRAIENALPLVYVNRVGVEDGLVFGGGSLGLDARGEEIPPTPVPVSELGEDERAFTVEIDPDAGARWRRFRPVLRDTSARPGRGRSGEAPAPRPTHRRTSR